MLAAAGVRHVPSQATEPLQPRGTGPGLTHPGEVLRREVLRREDGGEHGLALTLFKALQLVHATELDTALERYGTVDLETPDEDVEVCEGVDVWAQHVQDDQ